MEAGGKAQVKTRIAYLGGYLLCMAAAAAAGLASPVEPAGLQVPALFLPGAAPSGETARYFSWNASGFVEALPLGLRFHTSSTDHITFLLLDPDGRVKPEGIEPMEGGFTLLDGLSTDLARGHVPAFHGLIYRNVYSGIDFVVRFDGQQMKSEYRVSAGASPERIRFRYLGADAAALDERGNLEVRGVSGGLSDSAPEIYQQAGSVRKSVAGRFSLNRDGSVGFELGPYNASLPLVIDPALTYTSEFNGNQSAVITSIAADAHGNVYAAGYTPSTNFPVDGPFQGSLAGGNDAFVLKLNPQGNSLQYATYIGGSGDDRALGIAVDPAGEAIVVGQTGSQNFPLVSPAQAIPGGGVDAFAAKLNAAGNGLIFSTLLGGSGSDAANAVTVDSTGNIYLAGDTSSPNFPVLFPYQRQNQGGQDAFVTKLSAYGSILYSTFLGGGSADHASAIAVDSVGSAYVTGSTYSVNFPVAAAFQAHTGGGQDAFVTKLSPQGSGLVFSTYLGGSGGSPGSPESGAGIGVDASGNVYVAGTTSSSNFPTQSPLQSAHAYGTDLFAAKLAPTGSSLLYSTYLGGSGYDYANTAIVDMAGCLYIGGQTSSWDLPVANTYQRSLAGMTDAFAIKLNSAGGSMNFASYLGGAGLDAAMALGLDHQGNLYLAGTTQSSNFPQPSGMASPAQGVTTGFVSSISGIGDHTPMLNRFYSGFFNRAPDPGGLAGWTSSLDSGTPPAQVANNFFYSPEFYSSGILIGAAYLAVQGRDPDYAGFESYLPQLRSGSLASPGCLNGPAPNNTTALCSQLTIINTFMTSAYYQSTYGALANSPFVTAVYKNLLNQVPSQSVANNSVSQLNSGLTRSQFLQTIINGSQYTTLITNKLLVDLCYFVFLSRNPDPGGYQGWLNAMNGGLTPVGLFGGFVSSPEFLQSL